MSRRSWFARAVALQIVVLLVMVGGKLYTVTCGTRVMLKTLPVDPWDLFRGDYMILNYEISRLDLNTLASTGELRRNDTVYVTLEKEDKYWVPRSVSRTRPGGGALAIRGRVVHFSEYERSLLVDYGIESYFVPQHQGRDIEGRRDSLDAEVSIDGRGNAALARLILDDQEVLFR